MQTPQYQIDSLDRPEKLADHRGRCAVADIGRDRGHQSCKGSAVVSQYNIRVMIQIYATTQGRDLGAVAADVQKIIDATAKDAPKGA